MNQHAVVRSAGSADITKEKIWPRWMSERSVYFVRTTIGACRRSSLVIRAGASSR